MLECSPRHVHCWAVMMSSVRKYHTPHPAPPHPTPSYSIPSHSAHLHPILPHLAAVQWYDIVTQYRALFASDTPPAPLASGGLSPAQHSRAPLPDRTSDLIPVRGLTVRCPSAIPASSRVQEEAVIVVGAGGVARLAAVPANVTPGDSFELQVG